ALSIAGIVLIVIFLGAFVWYEWLGGRELVNYTNVVVLTEDTLQGHIITEEQVDYIGLEKELVNENAILSAGDIIGKAATHFIPKNTMLHETFFDETELVLKSGEYIAQIPVDWTISIPNTIRRGDNIIVYAATYNSEVMKELQQSTVQVTSSTVEENGEEGQQLQGFNPYFGSVGGAVEAVEAGGGELTELFHTTVAFARDNANQEVVTTSTVDRMNGSAAISNIEIITTPDEFEALEQQIKAGAKLIIMYSNDDSAAELTKEDKAEEEAVSQTVNTEETTEN
ncbi:hypothetical protein D7X33_21110, partial [Butyricicoccus sp. 1XD8-22]